MKKARSLFLALALAFALCAVPASAATVASGKCGANLTWTLDDAGTLTISGTGAMWDYGYENGTLIPPPWGFSAVPKAAVINSGVTGIGNGAFYGCKSLTSVTIPDSVTSIGNQAFFNCSSLTNINIPDSVTSIGDSAFYKCSSLQSIIIPDSVTSIGSWAFMSCTALETLSVMENNPNYKSVENVLFSKQGNTLIYCVGGKSGSYIMSTEQIPFSAASLAGRTAEAKAAKRRAESSGDSAPESTWQSHAPLSPAVSLLPTPCRTCVSPG